MFAKAQAEVIHAFHNFFSGNLLMSYYLGIARMLLFCAQVFVEDHTDITDQHAPLGSDDDILRRHDQQAFAPVFAQFSQLGGEVAVEIDLELGVERLLGDSEVAHQRLDYFAAQQVVGIQFHAAHDRQYVAVKRGIVFLVLAEILAVGRADFSNGANSQGNKVAIGVGGITLKISV